MATKSTEMAYNMTPIIMECVVPYPKAPHGSKCPVCNKVQRDSSSFKTHAREVHKTLDARTPTTCTVCTRTFENFHAGSIHYARNHGPASKPRSDRTKNATSTSQPATSPTDPGTPPTLLPSTPEIHAIIREVVNRSPPSTCLTIPRSHRRSQSPSTQDLIADFLHNSPTRPISPMTQSQPTTNSTTFCSRSPSPDIAPPIPLHSRSTICPNPEPQVRNLLNYYRGMSDNNRPSRSPTTSSPTSPSDTPPPRTNHQPSETLAAINSTVHRLRATLEDVPEDEVPSQSPPRPDNPPPVTSPSTPPPTLPPVPDLSPIPPTPDIRDATTHDARPNQPMLTHPPPDLDSSQDAQLPTNDNEMVTEFHHHWSTTFSSNLSWEDFSEQCVLFADACRNLATSLNQPPQRQNTEQPPNRPRHPRASRPVHRYNPSEAKRIQGLYRHSKKRAARKILTNNSTTYTGSKHAAQEFFTDVFSTRPCDTTSLLHHLQESVPPSDEDNTHLGSDMTEEEISTKLRSAANTAPGPDRVEYRHLKKVDPTQMTSLKLGKMPSPSSSTKRETPMMRPTSAQLPSCLASTSYLWESLANASLPGPSNRTSYPMNRKVHTPRRGATSIRTSSSPLFVMPA